jgi:putative endonuclease
MVSKKESPLKWHVYMLRCADGSLYTGIATDVARRVGEHNGSKKAARYTRSRQPVALAYAETAESRSAALVREAALKKLSRREKLALAASYRQT